MVQVNCCITINKDGTYKGFNPSSDEQVDGFGKRLKGEGKGTIWWTFQKVGENYKDQSFTLSKGSYANGLILTFGSNLLVSSTMKVMENNFRFRFHYVHDPGTVTFPSLGLNGTL